MRGKMFIMVLIAAGSIGLSTPGIAAEADQLLRARGLRPLGTIWITEGEGRLRLCFAAEADTLSRAMDRLEPALS